MASRTATWPEHTLQSLKPEDVAVILVSCERFISAFARDKHLHVLAGQLRYIVESDRRRLADWFFHVPNVFRQEIRKFVWRYRRFVVLGAIALRRETSVGSFIHHRIRRETDSKRAD